MHKLALKVRPLFKLFSELLLFFKELDIGQTKGLLRTVSTFNGEFEGFSYPSEGQ